MTQEWEKKFSALLDLAVEAGKGKGDDFLTRRADEIQAATAYRLTSGDLTQGEAGRILEEIKQKLLHGSDNLFVREDIFNKLFGR